jgi:hypothetical protein
MELFNIFKVLEKDDKELIHSSFIRFLITEHRSFCKSFLGDSDICFQAPVLEKSYTLQKSKRRIDIEAISIDSGTVLIIENKFKCFPYKQQLDSYDSIYDHYHKDKRKFKLLFCFDKTLVSFKSSWLIYDYSDLLEFISKNCLENTQPIKQVFIKQYYEFLNEYFLHYKSLSKDFRPLFENSGKVENKFWLRLCFSALHLKLTTQFEELGIPVRFDIDKGNTKIPLVNVVPIHWNIDGKELLIQFQGNDVKFYSHSNNRVFIERLISLARVSFADQKMDFKKLTRQNAGTYFIFKTKLTSLLDNKKPFTLEAIERALLSFYSEIDERIIATIAGKGF